MKKINPAAIALGFWAGVAVVAVVLKLNGLI